VDDGDRIEVRQTAAPVVRITNMDALLAFGEALYLVGASPDLLTRAGVANWNDAVVILAELIANRRVSLLEVYPDGQVVDLRDVVGVDRVEPGGSEEALLRVGDPLQGVDHVVGAERLAVVERDARPEFDRPLIRCIL